MRQILFSILLIINLFGWDKLYFLPQDGYVAEKEVSYLFAHSHKNIKIAIYSFTNKVFLKALKKAAKRGIHIEIVADYDANKNQDHRSIVPILKKLRNIDIHLINGRGKGKYQGLMHIKMFIVDNKIVSFGSANYTYSAFHNNYEILYINDNKQLVKKFIKIFNILWTKKRKRFRWF